MGELILKAMLREPKIQASTYPGKGEWMRQGGGGDCRQPGTQKGSKEKWKFLKYLLEVSLCGCGRERRVSNGLALRVSFFFSLFSISFSFFLIKPNSPTHVEFSDSQSSRNPCHSSVFSGASSRHPAHSYLCSPLALCGQECLLRQSIIIKLFYSLKNAAQQYQSPGMQGFPRLSPTLTF